MADLPNLDPKAEAVVIALANLFSAEAVDAAEFIQRLAALSGRTAGVETWLTANTDRIAALESLVQPYEMRLAAVEAALKITPPPNGGGDPETPPDGGTGTPPPAPGEYILFDPARVMTRPTSGSQWTRMLSQANGSIPAPDLGDNNAEGDSFAIILALVATRLNSEPLREKLRKHLRAAINSRLTRTLELGRNLFGYCEAASLIGFSERPFIDWVFAMVTREFGSGDRWGNLATILATNLEFNSNWATQCRRSVIAAAMLVMRYGTPAQQTAAANWLKLSVLAHKRDIGVPGSYPELPKLISSPSGWYGDSDPIVGINPPGTTQMIDGAIRYIGGFRGADALRAKIPAGRPGAGQEDRAATVWPPQPVTYHWEGLTPQVVTAMILHNHNLVKFNEASNAIVRAMDANYGTGENAKNNPRFINPPSGDDITSAYITDALAGTNFREGLAPDLDPDKGGVAWMDWYWFAA